MQQNIETGEIEVVKGRKEEQCERTAEYEWEWVGDDDVDGGDHAIDVKQSCLLDRAVTDVVIEGRSNQQIGDRKSVV